MSNNYKEYMCSDAWIKTKQDWVNNTRHDMTRCFITGIPVSVEGGGYFHHFKYGRDMFRDDSWENIVYIHDSLHKGIHNAIPPLHIGSGMEYSGVRFYSKALLARPPEKYKCHESYRIEIRLSISEAIEKSPWENEWLLRHIPTTEIKWTVADISRYNKCGLCGECDDCRSNIKCKHCGYGQIEFDVCQSCFGDQ